MSGRNSRQYSLLLFLSYCWAHVVARAIFRPEQGSLQEARLQGPAHDALRYLLLPRGVQPGDRNRSLAERWYKRHSDLLKFTLTSRQPAILYANSPDFRSTTVIPGDLGEGTVLLDYRKYFRIARPLSLAGRVMHYGRYGGQSDDFRLQDLKEIREGVRIAATN